jgi:hypothetical protein
MQHYTVTTLSQIFVRGISQGILPEGKDEYGLPPLTNQFRAAAFSAEKYTCIIC